MSSPSWDFHFILLFSFPFSPNSLRILLPKALRKDWKNHVRDAHSESLFTKCVYCSFSVSLFKDLASNMTVTNLSQDSISTVGNKTKLEPKSSSDIHLTNYEEYSQFWPKKNSKVKIKKSVTEQTKIWENKLGEVYLQLHLTVQPHSHVWSWSSQTSFWIESILWKWFKKHPIPWPTRHLNVHWVGKKRRLEGFM